MTRRSKILAAATAVCALGVALASSGTAQIGQPAPDFALPDATGQTVRLSDHRGRYVVLEWINPECPFVKKHYNSGNMPQLQKTLAQQDVTWLTISSTHPNHGQYRNGEQMTAWLKEKGAAPAAMLFDDDGTVGRAYGAKATPHMYVIDPNGTLIYNGAIDDKRSANPADIPNSKNYVMAALNEARAGKPVSEPVTNAYGCTIKYANVR